ncbi:hypothetical protein [Mycoplasma sp. 125]|uniref:hypothetical protein n=1 Tax=Mycoplasma sp. 125 TaxID=3447505 RepID=UPI003F65BDCD
MTGKNAAIASFIISILGALFLTISLVMFLLLALVNIKSNSNEKIFDILPFFPLGTALILNIIGLVFYFIAMVKTRLSAARILMIIGLFLPLLGLIGLIIAMTEQTNFNKAKIYINNGKYCSICGRLLQKNNQTIQNPQINTQ